MPVDITESPLVRHPWSNRTGSKLPLTHPLHPDSSKVSHILCISGNPHVCIHSHATTSSIVALSPGSSSSIDLIISPNARSSSGPNNSNFFLRLESRMYDGYRCSHPHAVLPNRWRRLSFTPFRPSSSNQSLLSSHLSHHRAGSLPRESTCSQMRGSSVAGNASNSVFKSKISQTVHARVQMSAGKESGLSVSGSANRDSGAARSGGVCALNRFVTS